MMLRAATRLGVPLAGAVVLAGIGIAGCGATSASPTTTTTHPVTVASGCTPAAMYLAASTKEHFSASDPGYKGPGKPSPGASEPKCVQGWAIAEVSRPVVGITDGATLFRESGGVWHEVRVLGFPVVNCSLVVDDHVPPAIADQLVRPDRLACEATLIGSWLTPGGQMTIAASGASGAVRWRLASGASAAASFSITPRDLGRADAVVTSSSEPSVLAVGTRFVVQDQLQVLGSVAFPKSWCIAADFNGATCAYTMP